MSHYGRYAGREENESMQRAYVQAEAYRQFYKVDASPGPSPSLSEPRSPSPEPEEEEPQPQMKLHLGKNGGLAIPAVHKQASDDDGLLSPRRIVQQVDAFSSMCNAGAGWGAALMHALQGHKMTEEQAALCIQAHWRRHETVVDNIAQDLAAEHIQRKFKERIEAAENLQRTREVIQIMRAATQINMTWRGHLARVRAQQLRQERAGKSVGGMVRRSLSFSKRKSNRAPSPAASPAPSPGAASPSTSARGGGFANRVKRSFSFDRKSSSKAGGGGSSSNPVAEQVRATRRTFVLERGPNGLGLELDATNTIVNIKPGGRAERQGLVCVNDTVITIDGKSCAGKLMQEVMVPGRPVYVVEISRPEMSASPPKPAMANPVRRSMSFDRKGGVKRSFSFDRKKW